MSKETLTWTDVQYAAERAFRIWTDQPELKWAEDAWSKLTQAGLTTFDGAVERCKVAARLLALASFYRDWCAVAFDERQDDEPAWWAEELELSPIVIGQLLGPDEEVKATRLSSELDVALSILMRRERETVVKALRQEYGDDTDFFIALWRSSQDPSLFDDPEDEDAEDLPPTDADVVNDLTEEKLAAFQWIVSGCESLCIGTMRFFSDSDR